MGFFIEPEVWREVEDSTPEEVSLIEEGEAAEAVEITDLPDQR